MNHDGKYRGRVSHVGQVETVGLKGFRKRIIVVCDDAEKCPQFVPFEQKGNGCDSAPPRVGDIIEVRYCLKGREWNGRFFPSLYCAGWEVVRRQEYDAYPADATPQDASPADVTPEDIGGRDDAETMPF